MIKQANSSIIVTGCLPILFILANFGYGNAPHVKRVEASHVSDDISALYNGIVGSSSNDHGVPRFTWWDHKGTREWIEYHFDQPAEVSLVQMQWFDDTGRGQCRVPASWDVFYKHHDSWIQIETSKPLPVIRDVLIDIKFSPVRTSSLRVEVQLQPGYSGGVLAWHVPGIVDQVEFPEGRTLTGPLPFTVEEGLFEPSKHPLYGLAEAPGAETITIFAPREDTDKFSNGVQVYPFKGWLYAQWQSTPQHEDTPDSRVVWSRSRDGRTWQPPQELAGQPEERGFMRSGAGFWSDETTLVAYLQRVDSWYPGKIKMTEARTTTDGRNWSPIRLVSDTLVVAENVKTLPCGRLLTGVHTHLSGSTKMYGVPAYTDQTDGLSGWTAAEMPQPLSQHSAYGRGIEHSWYLRNDGKPVMVFRDMNRSGYLLASVGSPDGRRWTVPVQTEMPDSNSMQCAGNLPDGTVFLVNNPTRNKGRIPLTISLSADGRHFDKAYLVRGIPQPRRFDGRAKGPGYSYPGAVIWNDYLYVAYATNKEDVEITRIPLVSLMLSGTQK